MLAWAGFEDVAVDMLETAAGARIQPATLDRWFDPAPTGERASYRQRLAQTLPSDELASVEALYRGQLTGQTVPWHTVTAFIVARVHDPTRRFHDPPDGRH